jgi:hypothetical protein
VQYIPRASNLIPIYLEEEHLDGRQQKRFR